MLKVPVVASAIGAVNGLVTTLEAATAAGTNLVVGFLGGAAPSLPEAVARRELRSLRNPNCECYFRNALCQLTVPLAHTAQGCHMRGPRMR